jgi:hypothetical protein
MAFRQELLDALIHTVVDARLCVKEDHWDAPAQKKSAQVFENLARHLAQAVEIRMRGEQAQVFMEIDEIPQQDYVQWLRQPFPRLFIQMDKPIEFRDDQDTLETHREPRTALVRAVLLLEYPRDERPTKIPLNVEVRRAEIERIFQVHFSLYDRETLVNAVSP